MNVTSLLPSEIGSVNSIVEGIAIAAPSSILARVVVNSSTSSISIISGSFGVSTSLFSSSVPVSVFVSPVPVSVLLSVFVSLPVSVLVSVFVLSGASGTTQTAIAPTAAIAKKIAKKIVKNFFIKLLSA